MRKDVSVLAPRRVHAGLRRTYVGTDHSSVPPSAVRQLPVVIATPDRYKVLRLFARPNANLFPLVTLWIPPISPMVNNLQSRRGIRKSEPFSRGNEDRAQHSSHLTPVSSHLSLSRFPVPSPPAGARNSRRDRKTPKKHKALAEARALWLSSNLSSCSPGI